MGYECVPAAPSVLEVLRDRRSRGSRPGHRSDPHRVVLLIEGGSSRSAYSNGMAVAIEQLGLTDAFDAVYGASAGALGGAWLLCGRAEESVHAWWDPQIMGRVISPRRGLRGGPVVDTRYLVHTIYERIVPMDFETVVASPVGLHPIGTSTTTGQAVDLHPLIRDRADLQAALCATTCMPILSGPPVRLGGETFIDAGVSESVPIHTALAAGATHVVALRTRRAADGPRHRRRLEDLVVTRWLRRHAPGAIAVWRDRPAAAQREERALEAPNVLQIRPADGSHPVGRMFRDTAILRQVVDLGREAAHTALAPALRLGSEPLAGPPNRDGEASTRSAACGPSAPIHMGSQPSSNCGRVADHIRAGDPGSYPGEERRGGMR